MNNIQHTCENIPSLSRQQRLDLRSQSEQSVVEPVGGERGRVRQAVAVPRGGERQQPRRARDATVAPPVQDPRGL